MKNRWFYINNNIIGDKLILNKIKIKRVNNKKRLSYIRKNKND